MKKAAVINDLSCFGRCSLTAALPVLAAMGVQGVPLPTAVLSAQTGYPSYCYTDLTHNIRNICHEWNKMGTSFDGISTGFVAGAEQFQEINAFLDTFQRQETIVLVDPVMGDNGHAFGMFNAELLEGMKGLCRRGTVLTPNLTECCLLTGMDYEALVRSTDPREFLSGITACGEALRRPGQLVVITGIPCHSADGAPQIGNLALWDEGQFFHAQPYNGKSYSGTGDLFAAVLLGGLLTGRTVEDTILLADHFLAAAIADAGQESSDRNDGVPFEQHLKLL
jgi:pyridoxine kinase